MVKIFIIYCIAMNVVAFALMFTDKRLAVANGRSGTAKSKKTKYDRIPEATLLVTALLFGGIGELAGMSLFRHKTKKWKFRILVPLFCIVNIVSAWFILKLLR